MNNELSWLYLTHFIIVLNIAKHTNLREFEFMDIWTCSITCVLMSTTSVSNLSLCSTNGRSYDRFFLRTFFFHSDKRLTFKYSRSSAI